MAKTTNATVNDPKTRRSYNYYRVRVKGDDGKYINHYAKNKTEGEAWKAAYLEAQKEKSTKRAGIPYRGLSFGDAVNKWLSEDFINNTRHKDTTKSLYIHAFHNIFDGEDILNKELSSLIGKDIDSVLKSTDKSIATRSACQKLLRLFFKDYEKHGGEDLARSTDSQRPKKRGSQPDTLAPSDEEDILKAFSGHRLYFLIYLAQNTGARISELLALKYDDITPESITINKQLTRISGEGFRLEDPKTYRSNRSIPINSDTWNELLKHKAWHKKESYKDIEDEHLKELSEGLIFTTSNGKPYDRSSIQKDCVKVCSQAGLTWRGFHIFRHTFASKLANKGVPIQVLSDLLGHTSTSITAMYYINVADQSKIDAINILKK